jgi:uncharacterized protein (DUF433 family)/DNA-binding transcriptional MerR regulator
MTDNKNVIRAFSVDHVVELTGLSAGQLSSWDRTDLFSPDYAYENRRSPYSRIYSFRDVVGLRTAAVLLTKYKVSVQELRKVAKRLIDKGFEHWADTKLYVVKRQVHFTRPATGDVEGVWDGQYAMLPVIDVIHDVEEGVKRLHIRSKSQYGKVEQHRYVARNASVIAGTRIPTAAIRRFSEAGYTVKKIMREYPALTKEDIKAALAYEKERVA